MLGKWSTGGLGNVLQICPEEMSSNLPGHHRTFSVMQKQIRAWLTGKSAKHILRNASTEIYLNELRSTLSFGHICVQFLWL